MASLCSVKVKNIRPEFNNLKEWSEDNNNVYIGRKGIVFITTEEGTKERYPKKNSIWANPFKLTKENSIEEVLENYESYIKERLEYDENLVKKLKKLKKKNLGCWCVPMTINDYKEIDMCCHGQILMKLCKKYNKM